MFREWRWCRKYYPTWRIVTTQPIAKITPVDEGMFKIELPIDIEYQSHDARYVTRVDCRTVLLHMFHAGEKSEKQPYTLRASTEP